MGTVHGPDARFLEDLSAIDAFVKGQKRSKARKEYVTWRQGLGWYDLNVDPNSTMQVAQRMQKAIQLSASNVGFGAEVTNVIDPYVPFTGLGDYVFNDDINAITTYIENQRPNIKKWPQLQKMIEDYEKWLINLGPIDKYVNYNDTLGQAKTQRDAINAVMGQVLDPSWDIADAGRIVPTKVVMPGSQIIPTWVKWTMGLGAGAAAVIALFMGAKSLTPLAFAKRSLEKRKVARELAAENTHVEQ
jgi:hypothetical protein